MLKSTITNHMEQTVVDLYNNGSLSETMLRSLCDELSDYFIDLQSTEGTEANDGKKFQEIICFTLLPLTHREIMETSLLINEDEGRVWENLIKADELFEYVWYSDLGMPDSEVAADKRVYSPV